MDRDLLSSAAPSEAVVAAAVVLCSTFFFFFFALGLLVLAAAGRSPKMSSVLPKRSSSDRPFGFLLFLVPLGLVFFLLPSAAKMSPSAA